MQLDKYKQYTVHTPAYHHHYNDQINIIGIPNQHTSFTHNHTRNSLAYAISHAHTTLIQTRVYNLVHWVIISTCIRSSGPGILVTLTFCPLHWSVATMEARVLFFVVTMIAVTAKDPIVRAPAGVFKGLYVSYNHGSIYLPCKQTATQKNTCSYLKHSTNAQTHTRTPSLV